MTASKCFDCKKPKLLNLNGLCKDCNLKLGFKECSRCQRLLFVLADFYYKSSICKDCSTKQHP